MTSVVFVHGTGVREDSYRASYGRVSRGLKRVRPDVRLIPCYWGDTYGAHLALGGASYPERDRDRALPGADADDPLTVWALLEQDPLAEIGLLADRISPGVQAVRYLNRFTEARDEADALEPCLAENLGELHRETLGLRERRALIHAELEEYDEAVALRERVLEQLVAVGGTSPAPSSVSNWRSRSAHCPRTAWRRRPPGAIWRGCSRRTASTRRPRNSCAGCGRRGPGESAPTHR
ncbi:hypothetical protein OG281_22820 [Streptomyces sp. NBC_01438]